MLHIAQAKSYILPLGAEGFSLPPKRFSAMHLLYVGTLSNRDLEKTVVGFGRFFAEMKGTIDLSYDIIGDGLPAAKQRVKDAIERSNGKTVIRLHGRIPYTELKPFFEKCTVGVAFIPITPYYSPQPSTKVFEYLLAGMPVVATETDEIRRVITPEKGVLIQDTAESFYCGLKTLYDSLGRYDSNGIKASSAEYTWDFICENNLGPQFDAILKSTCIPGSSTQGGRPAAPESGCP